MELDGFLEHLYLFLFSCLWISEIFQEIPGICLPKPIPALSDEPFFKPLLSYGCLGFLWLQLHLQQFNCLQDLNDLANSKIRQRQTGALRFLRARAGFGAGTCRSTRRGAGRATQGVRIMNVKAGDEVAAVARIA